MRRAFKKAVAVVCAITMAFSALSGNLLWKTDSVAAAQQTINVTNDNVLTLGKTFLKNDVVTFSYANSGVEINFEGSSISGNFVVGQDSASPQSIAVFVDGKEEPEDAKLIELTADGEYVLASGLDYGNHTVTIRKMNRSYYGFLAVTTIGLKSVTVDGSLLTKPAEKELTIEVFGDSITNGDATYQDDHYTSASFSWMGYVGEVARYFDADLKSCGISGQGLLRSILADDNGQYFNLFPPTNNWAKLDESVGNEGNVAYDHVANPADVVIINLGTNDNAAFSAGQISSQDFYTEYLRFINEIHKDCPDAIVVGTLGAMGADGLFSAIQNAVNDANAQAGYTYAYFSQLQNCNTIANGLGYDNSHPSQVAHKIYGRQLSELIESALLDKGVLDKNNYKKATVVAADESSVDDLSRTGQYAADGNASTRWASYHGNKTEWVEFELDQIYEVNKIQLSWEVAYAEKYRILTSLDGVNWSCDTEVNNGNGYEETKRLNGSRAKYIRVECTERGTVHNYSLYEVSIYGKSLGNVEEAVKGENVVGEMFMPVGITPSSASVLIDDSGMSGLEAPNHMHASFDSNDSASAAKISSNMYLGDKSSIVIDLGKKECLGQMYIWNYNDLTNVASCMKNVFVDYSEDGVNFTRMGMYTLGQSNVWDDHAYGGNVACTVDGGKSVDFNGVTGRYVRITPYDNYGGANYGLSEVRIFRHKTEPVEGEGIIIDAFTPEQLENTSIINAFNNSGLSIIDGKVRDDEKHNNDADDMGLVSGSGADSMIIMNLDGNYPLNTLKFWNYNDPDNLGAGIKEFELYYTAGTPCAIITHSNEQIAAGASDYIDFNQGDWKKLGTFTLPQGTGKDGLSAQLEIDLEGYRAQHIKIVPLSNYSGTNNQFGLSEVKAYVNSGWATEYSREWSGMLSSSGTFAYQGNSVADSKGASLNDSNNGRGWIGGDGFHTTRLNGSQLHGTADGNSKTIFTFQDSFEGNFGNYDGFGLEHGYGTRDWCGFSIGMRNHAYMFLEGDEPDVRNIKMYMQLEDGLSEANGYGGNIYPGKYWLGDSTVVNGSIYTVANQFEGLTIKDADFYKSPLESTGFPSMKAIPQLVVDDMEANSEAQYHETIYEEGDYLYVYGKKDNLLVVSRILAVNYPSLTGFEFWNGSSWVKNASEATAISSFMPGNEFNITKITSGTYAGKYMLVHTPFSITGAVSFAIADSPVGPFKEPTDNQMYWSTEKYKLHMRYYQDSPIIYQQWNYNAKSQPAISKAGELLISYHFGVHDDQADRVPTWGYFNAVAKEYEHPTLIKMFDIEGVEEVIEEADTLNLALNKTATASSNEVEERNAVKAVDGNPSTRWGSNAEDPSWIMVDLGESKEICKAVLTWEAAFGAKYRIEYSDDGITWKKAYTETSGDGGTDVLTFPTVKGRYVRMYGLQRGTFFGYSLFEFELYGPKESATETPTENQTTEKVTEIPTETPTEENTETPTQEISTVAPETTNIVSGEGPEEVFGQLISSTNPGIIDVVWGAATNGQVYNVYVDGSIATDINGNKLENIGCAAYRIYATGGTHTVKITSVLNNQESSGVAGTVEVTAAAETESPTAGEDGYTVAGANWNNLDFWSVYFASGWANNPTGAYRDGASYSDFAVRVDTASLTDWGVQMKTQSLIVEDGKEYICKVNVTSNMDTASNIRIKEEITQIEKLQTLKAGENTFELSFMAGETAQIFFDLGQAPSGLVFEITSFAIEKVEEETTLAPTKIEINGCQISTTVEGYRVVYSLSDEAENIESFGLVYGLADSATESDMVIGSANNTVYSYQATDVGKLENTYSEMTGATSYAMTMKFIKTAEFYNAGIYVRAYAKLKDGSYVYSDVVEYSVYSISDYLYQYGKMSTQSGHEYLFNNILSVVNSDYAKVEYNSSSSLIGTDN